MMRSLFLAATLLAAPQGLLAQDRPHNGGGQGGGQGDDARGGSGVRDGNITSTGQTGPNPGASQGAGTTALHEGGEREDEKIQGSICKGC